MADPDKPRQDAPPSEHPPAEAVGSPPVEPVTRTFEGRFSVVGGVRRTVARGTVVNAGFLVAVSLLGLIKGVLVAGFLSTADYGLWGVIVVSVITLTWLAQTGIGDKYVQQDEGDQQAAFQKAFTLELVFSLGAMVFVALCIPLVGLAYGRSDLVLPGLVLALALPATAFTSPVWVYHRQMRFLRQRMLLAVDPIVGFVVTIGLAVAGAGYWSLVAGLVVGPWVAAAVAVAASPYPLRLRWDLATMREYLSFSAPLFIQGLSGLLIAQGALFVGEWQLGLAAVGAMALTAQVTQFADRVDAIVTGALYPAICAMRDQRELLHESFVKSNRLALMWGFPFGVAVSLFADDLVRLGLGEKWAEAIPLLQAFGLIAAVNHMAFNWHAFYRAEGRTWPIAAVAGAMAAVAVCVTLPLIAAEGLDGFAIGSAVMVAVGLAGRAYFLNRLFPGFRMWRHMARATAPTVPAVLAVLALRWIADLDRTVVVALSELVLYGAVTVLATMAFERPLLREVAAYLRTDRRAAAASA
jgi:O-antigen/teichoic acid export membrane protein